MTTYRVIATTADDNIYAVLANCSGIIDAMAYLAEAEAMGVQDLEIIEADRYAA